MKMDSLITFAAIATLLFSLGEVSAADRVNFRVEDQLSQKSSILRSLETESQANCEVDRLLYPLIAKGLCSENDPLKLELTSLYQKYFTHTFQQKIEK